MFEIVILNKKDFPIRFGMNALRIYCKKTNTSLQDLDKLGQDLSLDNACQLILAGLQDGARVAGKQFSLTVEDVADILDDDMDALQKCFDVFSEQFTAKFEQKGNEKEEKKTPQNKK
jgi:hypothetical protein|tara:strand:- start:353 stop:703 length:351 start_codon:yes stop_codon:yes gene_type:complete